MSSRQATHAGSWYTDDGKKLNSELSNWLAAVSPSESDSFSPPIKGCKAVIAPHAGYSYSGPAAAWAYKSIDTTGIKRVFILGPSHHVYLDGCALSKCREYETPIGNLPLDLDTIIQLKATGQFGDMNIETDEDEHSIEMHLPYVRKIFQSIDIKVIPILVGAINKEKEAAFGTILAPYLSREDTFCVVSSDFCHWGTRFSYTHYYSEPPPTGSSVRLSRSSPTHPSFPSFPIHASISALDHEAIEILTLPPSRGIDAHSKFAEYLEMTKNTICGRHPIGVLLGALTALEQEDRAVTIKWVRYEQSSQCFNINDSSFADFTCDSKTSSKGNLLHDWHHHSMPPNPSIRALRSRAPRCVLGRRFASHEAPQYNEPTGWIFSEKPPPPGQKRMREDWEITWYIGMFGTMALAGVLHYYKPDTSIQSWALAEAKARMEERGEKYKYEPSP